MIHYITSVSASWKDVKRAAEVRALEVGSGTAKLVLEPAHLSAKAQQQWGDELWGESKTFAGVLVVGSMLEIPLLRLLRRVREKYEEKEGHKVDMSSWHVSSADLRVTVLYSVRRDPELERQLRSIRNFHEARTGRKLPTLQHDANGIGSKQLRVSNQGEFIDRWPEGFFEERMEELF